ncbi:MAG: DNA polymerase III subunit gamma/tau [Candidatus Tectomicrobia bacterium]|uniref:DNA polymerase III subunit gamma/tau n=1 Tax=Tectimicrobiota bacterium TaxID=2528274 RepID=A0A932GP08_UNCTE|nr:DNA polymerase III subunit gamma/tau [Candidatus Tectomicrobia bacterium]
MTYQVTARRWRPQTFTEIIGQEHVSRTLRNALEMGRIAHAYLFSGSRGVGKTTTARVLAKALNCSGGPRPDPCNRCNSCQEITAGTALDVIEIDGASNRGIDQIRELRETVHYVPTRGTYKVYIIDEVHMLTKEAFNALLKTLEEPPPHVIFIFATTEQSRIPPTILSRCQCYEFKQLPQALIAEQLAQIAGKEQIQISPHNLQLLAKMARGSMRDAQSLFDQVVAFCGPVVGEDHVQTLLGVVRTDSLRACLDAVSSRNAQALLETLHEVVQRGTNPLALCQEILEQFRHLLVIQKVPDHAHLVDVSPSHLEDLRRLAGRFSGEELHLFCRLLSQAEAEMRRSSDPLLHLEVGLLRLIHVKPLASLDELVARLDRMEERLRGGAETPPGTHPVGAPAGKNRPPERLFPETANPGRPAESSPPLKLPKGPTEKPNPRVAETLPLAELWQEIVNRSVARKPLLGTYLEPGSLLEKEAHVLTVGYAKADALHREKVQEGENRQILEEAASEVLGRRVQLRLRELPLQAPDVDPAPAQPAEEARKETEPQRATDIVQEALELFNGTIVLQ